MRKLLLLLAVFCFGSKAQIGIYPGQITNSQLPSNVVLQSGASPTYVPFWVSVNAGVATLGSTSLFRDSTGTLGAGNGFYLTRYSVPFNTGAPIIDFNLGTFQSLTLTGDATATTAHTATVGGASAWAAIEVCQDSVGGHLFTAPAGFTNFTNFNVDTAPNICQMQLGYWDGTNFRPMAPATYSFGRSSFFIAGVGSDAPTTNPRPGNFYCWFDNSTQLLSCKDGNGVIQTMTTGAISPTPGAPANQILAGCGVEYTSGLMFTVGACTYTIGGKTYTSPLTTITLSAADVTNPRIDDIIVDITSTVSALTGTPAGSPLQPTIDPSTQLELTFVSVAANATTPTNITFANIYDENTEWACTASAHLNCNSTNNPYHLTHDIEATAAVLNNNVTLVKPAAGTVDLAQTNALIFYIRSKATWPTGVSGATAARSLTVSWLNGATQKGLAVVVKDGTFGFSSANITSYQQISIPTTLFGAAGIPVTTLKFTITGPAGSSSIGFYLDEVTLQSGIVPPSLPTTLMNFKGTWSSVTSYVPNDTVVSGGVGYVALVANTNVAVTTAATWAAVGAAGASVPLGQVAVGTGTGVGGFTGLLFDTTTVEPAFSTTFLGLNDLTSGGTYTDNVANPGAVFSVTIFSTGTPDTFKWKKNGGALSSAIPITGSAQTLSNGVTVTFAATTGHTATDNWIIPIAQALSAKGHSAFGPNASIDQGSIDLPTTVNIQEDFVSGAQYGNAYGLNSITSSTNPDGSLFQLNSSNLQTYYMGASPPPGGELDLLGVHGTAQVGNPNGNVQADGTQIHAWGGNFAAGAINLGSTTMPVAYGVYSTVDNLTNLLGGGSGVITEGDLFYGHAGVHTHITNLYGVHLEDMTGATNNWAIKTGLGKVEIGDVIQADNLSASLPVQTNGSKQLVSAVPIAFSSLGTPANAAQQSCSDCKVTSSIDDTCTSGGSGAQAFRINGAWKCVQ